MTLGVAIRYRNGIVVASDSSVVDTYGPRRESARKIFECERGVFVGCGNINEVQKYARIWKADGLDTLLDVLRAIPARNCLAMVVQGQRVRLVSEDGTVTRSTARTAAIGSGDELAQAWLDGWEHANRKTLKELSERDARAVMHLCLRRVAKQDYQVRAPFHVHAVNHSRSRNARA